MAEPGPELAARIRALNSRARFVLRKLDGRICEARKSRSSPLRKLPSRRRAILRRRGEAQSDQRRGWVERRDYSPELPAVQQYRSTVRPEDPSQLERQPVSLYA